MRLFKRKPKVCENLSFAYNIHKPEEGVWLSLGYGEDKKLPGCSKREVACHHFEFDELDWLIDHIREIKNDFDKGE